MRAIGWRGSRAWPIGPPATPVPEAPPAVAVIPVPCPGTGGRVGSNIGTADTPVSVDAVSPNGWRSIPCSKVDSSTGESMVVVVNADELRIEPVSASDNSDSCAEGRYRLSPRGSTKVGSLASVGAPPAGPDWNDWSRL